MGSRFLAAVGAAIALAFACDDPARAADRYLGINVAPPTDYETEVPFVDVFRLSRAWISQRDGQPFGEGGPLALDADGWVASLEPGQHADTIMLDNGGFYPSGNYTVLFDGDGVLSFTGASVVSSDPGRIVISVPQEASGVSGYGGFWLRIETTNAGDPIRNIRVLMPGHESDYATRPFNPAFLDALRGYKGIRFMNWMNTNALPPHTWATRPRPATAQWQAPGIPVETMVALANELDMDPWFTMPHDADDEYVSQFAAAVAAGLEPGRVPTVEYSNETWNAIFPQAQYVIDQGMAAGYGPDQFQAGLRWHAHRAAQMFDTWTAAFGARPVHRALGAQAGSAFTVEEVTTWENASAHADSVTVAPYFHVDGLTEPDKTQEIRNWTVDQLLDAADAAIGGEVRNGITATKQAADARGMRFVAYEGGQHLAAGPATEDDEQLIALLTAANRHPRMETLYTKYLNQWEELGGLDFFAFQDVGLPTKSGAWGVLEYLGQPAADAPKYRALMLWANGVLPPGSGNPPPAGLPVPGPVAGPAPGDTTAPVFLSASLSPVTFAVDPRGRREVAARGSAVKKGTTFRYRLSEAGRVIFTIERSLPGRRARGKCAPPRRANRKRPRCNRFVVFGRFAAAGAAGANRKRFSGRIGRKSLKPGRYRATLVATDAAGNASARKRLKFRVVRPR